MWVCMRVWGCVASPLSPVPCVACIHPLVIVPYMFVVIIVTNSRPLHGSIGR